MKIVAIALCLTLGAFAFAENKPVSKKKPMEDKWERPKVEVEPEDGARWGLKAGVNLGNIKAGDNSPTGTRTAAAGGIVLELPFIGDLKLQAEGGYAEYGYTDSDLGITNTATYDVAEAQLLAKYRMGDVDSLIKPFILAGAQAGYRISTKVKNGSSSTDASEATKKFTTSAVVGGGVQLNLGGMDVGVDARYLLGLNDISESAPSIKNNTIYVGATLFF